MVAPTCRVAEEERVAEGFDEPRLTVLLLSADVEGLVGLHRFALLAPVSQLDRGVGDDEVSGRLRDSLDERPSLLTTAAGCRVENGDGISVGAVDG